MADKMSATTITEKDTTGQITSAYRLTTRSPQPISNTEQPATTRLDLISNGVATSTVAVAQSQLPQPHSFPAFLSMITSPSLLLSTYIAPLFLPYGYPHTVTPDYTPYQIYDSLQAFTSAITGLLASRAVLQSLGIDTEKDRSSTATYATLLSIAQSTTANLTTILFAHRASSRIASHVKYYRFLADIVNDLAFVLDCLSPSLPPALRAPVLCLSSASRAVCGVAAGSSKAVLSAHFAINGNIGELNAKDGSQETLVNLIGMWVGGVVVSRVEGKLWTWIWVLGLLGLHLWFNYWAVRSVRIKILDEERARLVINGLARNESRCLSVEDVWREEGIFLSNGLLSRADADKQFLKKVRMGVSLAEFAEALGGEKKTVSGSMTIGDDRLQKLLDLFNTKSYVLWFDTAIQEALVMLKENSTVDDQLTASWHAAHVARSSVVAAKKDSDPFRLLFETMSAVEESWPKCRDTISAGGWDMSSSLLEPGAKRRICLS